MVSLIMFPADFSDTAGLYILVLFVSLSYFTQRECVDEYVERFFMNYCLSLLS